MLGPPSRLERQRRFAAAFFFFAAFFAYPVERRLGLGFAARRDAGFLAAGFFGGDFFAAAGRRVAGLPAGFFLPARMGELFFRRVAAVFVGRFAAFLAGAADGRFVWPEAPLFVSFFLGGAGLPPRAAFALDADADDSAERREVLGVEDAAARLFGPASRVARRPSRRPAAPSASSGKPSSARL